MYMYSISGIFDDDLYLFPSNRRFSSVFTRTRHIRIYILNIWWPNSNNNRRAFSLHLYLCVVRCDAFSHNSFCARGSTCVRELTHLFTINNAQKLNTMRVKKNRLFSFPSHVKEQISRKKREVDACACACVTRSMPCYSVPFRI